MEIEIGEIGDSALLLIKKIAKLRIETFDRTTLVMEGVYG